MPYVGLSITPKVVRLVELKREGSNYLLSRYSERQLKNPIQSANDLLQNDELKKALESLKRECKVEFVKASLPEESAYLFKTEVEGSTEDEIRSAIEVHLEENVPISGEDALFDFHIFKQEKGKTDVSVTALPSKVVEAYVQLFNSCGIIPLSFLIEPTAIAKAVVDRTDMGSYLIVNLGETKASISIVSSGAIQFTSTVTIGSESFTAAIAKQFNVTAEEAEKIKKEKGFLKEKEDSDLFFALANTVSILKDEIERVYIYWQTHKDKEGEVGKSISKIILSGKDATLLGFRDHLALSLKIPVEIGNPWVNAFSFDEIIPSLNETDALNYAACIGLALPKS